MPRGPTLPALGNDRAPNLDQQEQCDPCVKLPNCRIREDQQQDPAELCDADGDGIGLAGPAPRRIMLGGAQPQEEHRDPHHHVAGDRDAVVDGSALVDRVEHLRESKRQDDHADHLHHRG
jgi:hypothetical protein